jgi:preprotein translocase subunit Sec63
MTNLWVALMRLSRRSVLITAMALGVAVLGLGVPAALWKFWRELKEDTQKQVSLSLMNANHEVDQILSTIDQRVQEQVGIQV